MDVDCNHYNANYYVGDSKKGSQRVNNNLSSSKFDINKQAQAFFLKIKEVVEGKGTESEKYAALMRLEKEFNAWVKQQEQEISAKPEPQRGYELMKLKAAEWDFQNKLIAALEQIKEEKKKKGQ
jgi:hypothetical protein